MPPPSPSFGKRNASRPPARTAGPVPLTAIAPEHAAFFATLRDETAADEARPLVVPRSFRAALLAGLVVGACLAGLDATQASAALRHIASLVPDSNVTRLLPIVILLGLLGGARAAATNLLVSHSLLRRLGWTHPLAYALGGAGVAACVSGLMILLAQGGMGGGGMGGSVMGGSVMDEAGLGASAMLHSHGLAIDLAAGAGTGFFYRIFAGSLRA